MNRKIILILALSMVLYGCSPQLTFEQGIRKLDEIDESYGSGIKAPPKTVEEIDGLLNRIEELRTAYEIPGSLDLLIGFRIKFLEAEKLNAEGWQWGKASTTDYGFGCKEGYARISESARLRNMSALAGYDAVETLQAFLDSYPDESGSTNLTQKDILVLNALYFGAEEKALRDAKIIEGLCGNKGYNKTLPI